MFTPISINVGDIIVSALIIFLSVFINNRMKVINDSYYSRKEESAIVMKTLRAIGKLSYANSLAITERKTNGEMKDALKDYDEVAEKLDDFIINQYAEATTKK